MTEQIGELGFGSLEKSRNEMIEIFENPKDMETLVEYFDGNIKEIDGLKYYSCNGNGCDCRFGRTFAMLKYIAQLDKYNGLQRNCTDFQLKSIQESYFYRYSLPLEEIELTINPEGNSKIKLNGELFGVSKSERVREFGLEDFIEVSIPKE